jgi:hypothetical protein
VDKPKISETPQRIKKIRKPLKGYKNFGNPSKDKRISETPQRIKEFRKRLKG